MEHFFRIVCTPVLDMEQVQSLFLFGFEEKALLSFAHGRQSVVEIEKK